MPSALSAADLQRHYRTFLDQHFHTTWFQDYLAELRRFQALTDEAFQAPDAQRALWNARGVTGLGLGEVDVGGAVEAPEVVSALRELRHRAWPQEPGRRARDLQAAYDHVLSLVHPQYAATRPWTRLRRLFAALLPAEMTTCLTDDASRSCVAAVLGPRDVAMVEGASLVRARLRDALGPEPDLEEHVRRSMFCWWLQENHPVTNLTLTLEASALTSIGLDATSKQPRRWRLLVSTAREGADRASLIQALNNDTPPLGEEPASKVIGRAEQLGLLEEKDGRWHSTPLGLAMLPEETPDLLIERLLERVFGVAWVLMVLHDAPRSKRDTADAVREVYPKWTSDYTVGNVLSVLEDLGLVHRLGDGRRDLTDHGRHWAARLPEELPLPGNRPPTPAFRAVAWADLHRALHEDEDARHLVFEDTQVLALHLAWHASRRKRFAILSGLSGTGKTEILCLYARLYCELLGLPPEAHTALIAVSPDWRDPTGPLGYVNALHASPSFEAGPALRLLLEAAANPSLPYFLLLDEMNLARVERYFAPFLSSMESGREVRLHAHHEPIDDVPPVIAEWPANLFLGGTVNMDETTHPFSDKVLDRAFTLEFHHVDLPTFFERRAALGSGPRLDDVETVLHTLYAHLHPIRRHFGYRTAGEILDFVQAGEAAAAGGVDRAALLDQAVFSKVLPRIRGQQSPELTGALESLHTVCEKHGLRTCADKLGSMRSRLEHLALTGFWS